jgi:outer membrane protein OmpA-like peptidoglycan-associated protein
VRRGGLSSVAAVAALLALLLPGACAVPSAPVKACHGAVRVYFARGIDQLGLAALDRTLLAVSTLEACPRARATVTGHVDATEIGIPRLGLARAANVRSIMVKRGIERARITVRDAAFARPARPTAPGIAEPKNRFVAIEWR